MTGTEFLRIAIFAGLIGLAFFCLSYALLNRTNVWDYAGVNTFREGRLDELEMHPTSKPVGLVADAIKDCGRRVGIILDPFGGSGTTLIAAHRSGRLARLIEYDPAYCDVILQRFETITGTPAILARTGQSFEDVAARAHLARPRSRQSCDRPARGGRVMSELDEPPSRYRNPPVEHRFRKGVSGNPRGRIVIAGWRASTVHRILERYLARTKGLAA